MPHFMSKKLNKRHFRMLKLHFREIWLVAYPVFVIVFLVRLAWLVCDFIFGFFL